MQWHVPSRPHVNPLEAKPRGSSWPPKLLAKVRPLPAEWRNLTDTGKQYSGSQAFWCNWIALDELNHVFSPTITHYNIELNRLSVLQPWYCGSPRDPSVPEVHWAPDPQAALPAPGEGNRPRLQDRSPFSERRHRSPAGQLGTFKPTSSLCVAACQLYAVGP